MGIHGPGTQADAGTLRGWGSTGRGPRQMLGLSPEQLLPSRAGRDPDPKVTKRTVANPGQAPCCSVSGVLACAQPWRTGRPCRSAGHMGQSQPRLGYRTLPTSGSSPERASWGGVCFSMLVWWNGLECDIPRHLRAAVWGMKDCSSCDAPGCVLTPHAPGPCRGPTPPGQGGKRKKPPALKPTEPPARGLPQVPQ